MIVQTEVTAVFQELKVPLFTGLLVIKKIPKAPRKADIRKEASAGRGRVIGDAKGLCQLDLFLPPPTGNI